MDERYLILPPVPPGEIERMEGRGRKGYPRVEYYGWWDEKAERMRRARGRGKDEGLKHAIRLLGSVPVISSS